MENKDYYVDKHDTQKIEFGLEKIYKLLAKMENPQEKLNVIHIAGTNGKGSVATFIAYILAYAGFKVGKISSPVVYRKMEFAQVYELCHREKDSIVLEEYKNNENDIKVIDADEEAFNSLIDRYRTDVDIIKTSGYETQVACSLKYMQDIECDIVIVECGMGGALDATNVFKNTLCDVITSISLDHVGMIGDTVHEIAKCKCGIISHNGYVVTTSSNKDVIDIIKKECKSKQANLCVADVNSVKDIELKLDDNRFIYKGVEYRIKLNGKHQIENAIISIDVIKSIDFKRLSHKDIRIKDKLVEAKLFDKQSLKNKVIEDSIIQQGLELATQQGRLDCVNANPMIVADGAHNVDGATCLVQAINEYFIDYKKVYIVSTFKDKDYKGIASKLLENADEIWVFETENPRCLKAEVLIETFDLLLKDKLLENEYVEDLKLLQNEQLEEVQYKNVSTTNKVVIKNIKNIENILSNIEKKGSAQNANTVYICAGSLSFMRDIYGRIKVGD